MGYKYETHLHTSEASACGRMTGAEHARRCKALGYTGILVTDHFFNGNCGVDRSLPWEEKARLFCLGYENAKAEGDKIGLDVYFGWEANYNGAEFLIYGLSPDWLIHHPEVMEWSIEEQFQQVSAAGGLVVQAHPFREDWYIKEVKIYPEYAHAFEVFNTGNETRDPIYNDRALAYATEHGIPMTAGSDAHGEVEHSVGVEFPKRLAGLKDYIEIIKTGKGYSLIP